MRRQMLRDPWSIKEEPKPDASEALPPNGINMTNVEAAVQITYAVLASGVLPELSRLADQAIAHAAGNLTEIITTTLASLPEVATKTASPVVAILRDEAHALLWGLFDEMKPSLIGILIAAQACSTIITICVIECRGKLLAFIQGRKKVHRDITPSSAHIQTAVLEAPVELGEVHEFEASGWSDSTGGCREGPQLGSAHRRVKSSPSALRWPCCELQGPDRALRQAATATVAQGSGAPCLPAHLKGDLAVHHAV